MSRQRSPQRLQQHRANLRAWATFRRACGNELVVDAELMRFLGLSNLLPNVIPRPIAISRKLSRLKPAWPWLFVIAAALWMWLLFPLLLGVQIVRTWVVWRKQPRRTEPVANDVGVVLTPRVCDVVRCVPAERRPRCWITTPWLNVAPTEADGEAIPLLSYARRTDLLRAAWLAWRAVGIIQRKGLGRWPGGQSRTAILQTYIAWDWFLTWQVLPRCMTPSAGVWFANHYDRWTVLLDRLPAGGPRHLVQHGFARGELTMPYQQRRVSEVLYFDQGTRQILQDVALSPRCRPRWTAIKAELKLTPWSSVSHGVRPVGFRVLVIGQPI
ncbi:MAG TPA: hypothetical protein VM165_21140, partial [Planctomycetaceae bacterium]|nr:hypothetical protein [Planctomycetaceae bacterium]